MLSCIATTLALTVAAATAATATSISVTPHDKYSSSVGVLGCYVNTNRIAYFPEFPSCDSVCVEVSANGRTVNLLHIDQSGGAYDISYDAWNYLSTGEGAKENPTQGGGFPAEYKRVNMDKCKDLITTPSGKLPLTAANSMNFYSACPADSYIGKNTEFRNIANSACTLGFNEVCTLAPGSNNPTCAHTLGSKDHLAGLDVVDLAYGTGIGTKAVQ